MNVSSSAHLSLLRWEKRAGSRVPQRLGIFRFRTGCDRRLFQMLSRNWAVCPGGATARLPAAPVTSGSGTLCASWQCLEVPRGPPPSLAVQFAGSGTSLSGMDVELVGSRYRMSLVKKRFATGNAALNACAPFVSTSVFTRLRLQ